jgi:hypothetical protein
MGPGARLGAEIFLGIKRTGPAIKNIDESLAPLTARVASQIRDFSHEFKRMCAELKESFATDHLTQQRISKWVINIHVMITSMSKLDQLIRVGPGGEALARDRAIVNHLFALLEEEIDQQRAGLRRNTDESMRACIGGILEWGAALPNGDYAIPESTPVTSALGNGKQVDQAALAQFGTGSMFDKAGV